MECVCVKLFHRKKLDVFHKKQHSDLGIIVCLPTYIERGFHRDIRGYLKPKHFISIIEEVSL